MAVLLIATACSAFAAPDSAKPETYLTNVTAQLRLQWPANRTVNIVCHGHSVPAGYFKTPVVDTFNAYPHRLHRGLNERFPHTPINVIVTAIGGENSERGAKRFERDVLSLRPDVVTIDYALNDRRLGLARDIKVILLTPTADTTAKWDDPNDPLNQQAAQIRRLAAEYGVALADSFAAFRAKVKSGVRLEDLMSQSNHPNRAGHELVADELLKWFPKE